ncbi:hypothetical protein DERP_003090 [Dermatophagoides pteronyssinus]|uniref:Uncharacterized protein n=1 Tax=Dermatophagoides pteronyssinus TaxID=6956 RepID=A0ABQ8JIM1_DERPT|nr:hypothetical protein DERP_003090 [Dermatophagoides pteronyssinus]
MEQTNSSMSQKKSIFVFGGGLIDYLHCNVPTLFAIRHGNMIVSPIIDVLSIGSISKRCGGNRPIVITVSKESRAINRNHQEIGGPRNNHRFP